MGTRGFPWKQQQQQQQADPYGSTKLKQPKVEPCEEQHSPPLPPPVWDDDDWEITPLAGDCPFFATFMAKCHVQKQFQLVIPARVQRHLPEARVPAKLLCRGRSWAATYCGDNKCKNIGPEWRDFAVDNGLRVGDACVFELITPAAGKTAATGSEGDGGKKEVVFKVQVLRGGLPEEITCRGATSDEPLDIVDDD